MVTNNIKNVGKIIIKEASPVIDPKDGCKKRASTAVPRILKEHLKELALLYGCRTESEFLRMVLEQIYADNIEHFKEGK